VSGEHHAPSAFYPQGNDRWYLCIGGWVGLNAGWTQRLEQISCASDGDRTPAVQSVLTEPHGSYGLAATK
jgi:hypothetical protein